MSTREWSRQLAVPVTALVAMLVLVLVPPATAQEPGDVMPARVGGEDRFDTAAEIAALTYPDGVDTALLARADLFPDALTAAPLAAQVGGPVLLTNTDRLTDRTAQALQDLGVSNVYLLGGPPAISDTVAVQLRDVGYDVGRLEGPTRYGTAAAVARETARLGPVAQTRNGSAVFIAYGGGWQDAAIAGPPASASTPIPLLLTQTNDVPPATVAALSDLEVGFAYVMGSSDVVSDAVVAELEGLGITTTRLAGATAEETATVVARTFVDSGQLSGSTTLLARGDVFADALTIGPHGGAIEAPLLYAPEPDRLGAATRAYLDDPPADIDAVRAVGSPAAVSTQVLGTAVEVAAAGTGGGPRLTQTCTNDALGYRIAYPAGWTQVDCRYFDPEPFELEEGTEPSLAIDVQIQGSDAPFGPATIFEPANEVEDVERFEVDGQQAVRARLVATEREQLLPEGLRYTEYVIDRPAPDGVLFVDTHAVEGNDYPATLQVLDRMIQTLDLQAAGVPATQQTYVVEPLEAVVADVGDTAEVRVTGRYTDDGLADLDADTLDLALFPCARADVTGGDADTFRDDDGDGAADGLGVTDRGNAAFALLNGQDIRDPSERVSRMLDPQDLLYDAIVRDGEISVTLASPTGPDCAVIVTWDDDGDGQFGVGGSDVGEVPVEPYGVAQVRFVE